MAETYGGGTASRSSLEREYREKSQSDERSVSQNFFGGGGGGSPSKKVKIEVENNSEFYQTLSQYDIQGFQMRPNFGEKFSSATVEPIIETVLRDFFEDKKVYDSDKASRWIVTLSKELTNRVRQLNYPRYKIVSHVMIGEHMGGGIHLGMKCLWDAETDSFATYTYIAVSENLFLSIYNFLSSSSYEYVYRIVYVNTL
jgi:hypothetical protein